MDKKDIVVRAISVLYEHFLCKKGNNAFVFT